MSPAVPGVLTQRRCPGGSAGGQLPGEAAVRVSAPNPSFYRRGRGRTGRFRLSILTKPGRRRTGSRAGGKKKKNLPFPLPQPRSGTPGWGHTLGRATCAPRGSHTCCPHRNRGEQNRLGLAVLPAVPPRNQPAPGPPGKSGWPVARDVSHEPRSGRAPPAQPRHLSPQGSQHPGARPAVSPHLLPACHHCCSSRMSLVPKPRTQCLQRASSFIFLMSL